MNGIEIRKVESRKELRAFLWRELSWQLEDNEPINRFAASIGAGVYKKYRIFEKPIPSRGA